MKTYIFFCMEENWVRKFRVLVTALILSCSLNIGLVLTFVFFKSEDQQTAFVPISSERQEKIEASYKHYLLSMKGLSFAELVAFLTNRELIEEGLAQRDLALACLVSFHEFNLAKALSSPPAQVREIALSSDQKISLYPGLDDEQFDAIIRFAYQEKWPLTAKGLFQLLKKKNGFECEESLIHSFFTSAEFRALELLFQKTQSAQAPKDLLALALDGSWDSLKELASCQVFDLSIDKRRQFLLNSIAQKSSIAAELLLKTDFSFARQKLDDATLLQLISLLKEKTPLAEKFCVELLSAPRTDLIWQAASLCLYAFSNEAPPQSIELKESLTRFAPSLAPISSAPSKSSKEHVVKEGENLWKIAKQYKMKVDELVKLNELEKDQLRPGMVLKVF
jgi:hypothetical protein